MYNNCIFKFINFYDNIFYKLLFEGRYYEFRKLNEDHLYILEGKAYGFV